jgi:type 1 fimbriae regulatory protein FimB/type 1 fimbriae regulatory protein FimE
MSVSDTTSAGPQLLKVKKSPNNRTYAEVRSREHLLPEEVEAMIKAAKRHGRHGRRDSTLILLCYRHGLRVSELVALKWEQIGLKQACIHINRLKQGVSSTHPPD